MKLLDFLGSLGKKQKNAKLIGYAADLAQNIQISEAAFHTCSNLIANLVAKCELKTYRNNEFTKGDEWYRWNVQPNPNQNATQFWQKFIHRLYEDNEALIVPRLNGELYVADSFIRDDTQAFNLHTYSGIQIDGYAYPPTLKEDQVYYVSLHDVNIKELTDNIAGMYAQMASAFVQFYKNSVGMKAILYVDQVGENDQDLLKDLMKNQFKTFFESVNCIQPLFNGFKFEPVSNTTSPGIDTRDFTAQIKDVSELYASSFGIPKSLITGEVQDTSKAIDQLLTFCLDPLLELIGDELNRKLFAKDDYLKGNYVQWQTNAIKHIDILDVAGNVEKLISSGFCCIDDIRSLCGMDRVNTEWSTQFFMTKNFSTIDELLQSIERGETIETRNIKEIDGGDNRTQHPDSQSK